MSLVTFLYQNFITHNTGNLPEIATTSYQQPVAAPAEPTYQYRDRAKERRGKHGIDSIMGGFFGNKLSSNVEKVTSENKMKLCYADQPGGGKVDAAAAGEDLARQSDAAAL